LVQALVVESREEIASVLKGACDPTATLVKSASEPAEAERSLSWDGPFELVVISMDIGMNETLALVEQAKQQKLDSIVVCVFDHLCEHTERALRSKGASMCIPRPWVGRRLFQVVWHVHRRKVMRESHRPSRKNRAVGPFRQDW